MVATETNDAYRFHGFRNEYSWIDKSCDLYESTHHNQGRGQFSQVMEKVSRMTFMNRQQSLTTRFVSMVSIMNIHGRQIVRLVNTLDDFYQAVVLDNHRNNIREKSLSEFSRIMAAKTLKNPYITGRQWH